MTHHRSYSHLLYGLPTVNPTLLALPVVGFLPPLSVSRTPLPTDYLRLEGAAYHADYLPNIGPQAHIIKQADQGVKCTPEPAGV